LKALILAGGYATRLRPLSCTKPKLLFPVAGKPMLEWTIERLSRNGIDEVVLAINYMADVLIKHFKGEFSGVKMLYSIDPKPLGTGGPIKNAEEIIGKEGTFLAMNGDIFSDIAINEMLKIHRESEAIATIALHEVEDPSRFGVVEIYDKTRIKRFVEKPKYGEAPSNLINAGIYLMEPEIFNYIPAGRKVVIEKEVFPVIAKEGKLSGCLHKGLWFDIGKIADYVKVNRVLLKEMSWKNPIIDEGARISDKAEITPPAIVKRDAVIEENARIGPYTIVGQRTRVGEGSKIKKSIIFEEVQIGEGSLINEAIVGERVVIGKRVNLKSGVVVGGYATIYDNVTLTHDVIVCPYKEVEESVRQPKRIFS
jgi:NDP-sugar pyrophosphorylase family protein